MAQWSLRVVGVVGAQLARPESSVAYVCALVIVTSGLAVRLGPLGVS